MEGKRFEDIVRRLIYIQLFLTSVCVGSSPCMPKTDRLGRYTVIGGGGNLWSMGVPSGSRIQVSVRCDAGAIAQQSVTSQCSNGTWIPPWPRCEKPCSVPSNKGEVHQFVNGDATMPITSYYTTSTLPDGTQLVARCRDPGKYRLIGDQRRTCQGGQWTGEEPECQHVQAQVLFYQKNNKWRDVASNGTVVVYVQRGNLRRLDVVCNDISGWLRYTHLTTPLLNDGDLWHWHRHNYHGKRLYPISTDFSGMYTCNGSSSSHSVHVLFKAAECDVPAAPEHGRILDGYRQQARDIFPSGTSVSFECEDDYRLVGSRRITCEKGQWSDDPPVCTVSRCPELTIPDHAIMEGVYGYGRDILRDERIFYCKEGYVLRGDTNNLRCLESGVWSDPLPTCEAVVHQVSPCASVRCESWQRCEVTGPNTTVCGCINPTSCLTSGPTVCGTNGDYYSSECHLRAYACLHDLQLDIAENDYGCINGAPDEDQPTIQLTADESPVAYSSSSFDETLIGAQSVPTEPPHEADPPTESAADIDSPADYYSFISLVMDAPADENNEDTKNSPPPPTTRTQPARNVNETTELTPFNSTFLDPTLEALIPE
uniref:Complement related-short n=1 Tax=Strongylocentrotus purpuratus TaxID=7668 RepID=Q6RSH3_STRPU|nr:complement related-short precursor [Strongylocentrotus purpuratus]AAR87483.1 complement related-short precursor [Strongylocentrotus purpuratus]